MLWWITAATAILFLARYLWRSYNHPSHVLGRQAANMNWVAIGTIEDAAGFRDLRVTRAGIEAVISFRHGNVRLVVPRHQASFRDFVELERWLGAQELRADGGEETHDGDPEILFYRAVEKYITEMGFYEPLLVLQGSDEQYCIAAMKMQKAGYYARKSPKVVGALTMDAVRKYDANRELAILFLQALERRFIETKES